MARTNELQLRLLPTEVYVLLIRRSLDCKARDISSSRSAPATHKKCENTTQVIHQHRRLKPSATATSKNCETSTRTQQMMSKLDAGTAWIPVSVVLH